MEKVAKQIDAKMSGSNGTMSIEMIKGYAKSFKDFKNREEVDEFWNETLVLVEQAVYRVFTLIKSNLFEYSELLPDDQQKAKDSLRDRFYDLAAWVRFAENTQRTYVVYRDKDSGQDTFAVVPQEERFVMPDSKKKQINDAVRLLDSILNYTPDKPKPQKNHERLTF